MALTPKDPVLFEMYVSLAERLASGARGAVDLVVSPIEKRSEIAKRIGQTENEADEILGNLIRKIDDMFVTPYDRGDLQDLANALDDAMDALEEATDLAVLHNVGEFPQGTVDLVEAVRKLAELTSRNISSLKNLKDIDHYVTEANKIEDEGDRIHRRITAMLFSGSYDAMTILRIVGVIDLFEDSLDEMARVARVMRTISLKES